MLLESIIKLASDYGYDLNNPSGDWTLDKVRRLEKQADAAWEQDEAEGERLDAEVSKLYKLQAIEKQKVQQIKNREEEFDEDVWDSAKNNAGDWLNEIGKDPRIYYDELPYWQMVIDTAIMMKDDS